MARNFSVLSFFPVSATSASASLCFDVNASRLLDDYSVDVMLVALPTELMARNFSVLSFFPVSATSASASLCFDVNASRLLDDYSVDVMLVAVPTELMTRDFCDVLFFSFAYSVLYGCVGFVV